ncbi:MAG: hypothetical protein HYZ13_04030 [Acidobacteria bacterium]|nr:hypothetical protein [Acidobacteriota bacterium]
MNPSSQMVLEALNKRLGLFRSQELREMTGLSKDQVHSAISTLVRRGHAERMGEGRVFATKEGLLFLEAGKTITSGPNKPRVIESEGTSLRFRLWKAIRMAQKASVSELLELAARGSEQNARQNARQYLHALVKSGHILLLTRRAASEWPVTTGESRYCLVLNTGPRAPQYNRRQKRIFDPNTGETFDLA